MRFQFLVLALTALIAGTSASAHEIIKGSIKSSDRFYPGTEREVQVYVPDAYNGSSPACLYVGLDGILCNAPQVMDSLIAAHKMPVTIGIFLQPGVIKDRDGNVTRYNRSNEFDMTSDKFVSFLEAEIIPWVERLHTAQGFPIKLSRRGADGMIFGLSSGPGTGPTCLAVCLAAWVRLWRCGAVTSCKL